MPSPQSDMESLKMPIIPRFLTSFQNVSLLSEHVGKITGRTSLRLNVTVTVTLPMLARNHMSACGWGSGDPSRGSWSHPAPAPPQADRPTPMPNSLHGSFSRFSMER